MQIKCSQHKIPLNIEEKTLTVFGTPYPATIGRCTECRNLYINRMIFPSCSTFQVEGQTYCFSGELHSKYPPKELPRTPNDTPKQDNKNKVKTKKLSKKEEKAAIKAARKAEEQLRKKKKEAERKRKARETAIREMKNDILNDKYKEYRASNVYFLNNLPDACPHDGDELVDVKRTSFIMYGVKVKAHSHCCIRCSTAYLHSRKLTEIQEKVAGLKKSNKPLLSSGQKSVSAKPSFVISYTMERIPVLEKDDTHCPFCKKSLMKLPYPLKYASYDVIGKRVVKKASMQGCQHCQAVFADKEQIYAIRKDNLDRKVHTVIPLLYMDAPAMMEATKLTMAQENESTIRLPYEANIDIIENISRESKIVQVYASKCHCQKCEDRYKRITTINRTAVVDTIDGTTESINVMFCIGCGQYFVSIVTLEHYKNTYGGVLLECKLSHELNLNQYSWFDFAPDSVLSRCGYTVKEGVSREYRQGILRYILETRKATKYQIIEKINSFIFFRENQIKYKGACQRWKEDINFVNEYKIQDQKKVYGLEFKPTGTLKK